MTKELLQQLLEALESCKVFDGKSEWDYFDLDKVAAAITAGKQALAQQEPNPWQDAVIDQLVVHHIYQAIHDTDPRKAVHDLLCISNDIALDPQVSSDAQALVDRGRMEAQQEQPSKTERQIRRMFCVTYASDSSPYLDDGEAQDNSMFPCIDFLRDSPEQIQSKMVERAIAKHKAQQEQPAWIDIAHRTSIVSAVYEQLKKEFTGYIAPFDRLDADTVQRLVDSIKWMTQPAQEPVAWYLSEDSNILGVEWSRQKPKYGRDWTPLYKTAPTQPALSDAEILNCFSASKAEGMASYMLAVGRAIEAHCRGGNHG